MSKWRDVWLENYNNNSEAAKNIDLLMKKNYKGHNYVPWSVMVKWLYLMDENADLDVIINEKTDNNIVFTDKVVNEQNSKGEISTKVNYSHFIRIKCVFMDKVFYENYPIQDNAYNAPNYYDSNMVNKSIQRAKAKIISIATGLGFQLYETGDLQFENDTKNEQNVVKVNKIKKPLKRESVDVDDIDNKTNAVRINDEHTKVSKEVIVAVDDDNKDTLPAIENVIELIRKHGDNSLPILQSLNTSLVKTYSFSLKLEDSDEELREKLLKVSNIDLFSKMMEKRFEGITRGVK